MFSIETVCYQRINCEKFAMLSSEKCKMLCYRNSDIPVTMVTKRTGDPYIFCVFFFILFCLFCFSSFLLKFMSGTLNSLLDITHGVADCFVLEICSKPNKS